MTKLHRDVRMRYAELEKVGRAEVAELETDGVTDGVRS